MKGLLPHVGICTLVHLLLPSLVDERDLPHQMRLIDDVVDCSIPPMAEEGIVTYLLCVSLVSPLKETESKMCLFKIGQYHLALLTSPHEEAYEQLFKGLLV